jgi:hypothetical protein
LFLIAAAEGDELCFGVVGNIGAVPARGEPARADDAEPQRTRSLFHVKCSPEGCDDLGKRGPLSPI